MGDNEAFSIVAGIMLMIIKLDELKERLRPLADAANNGEEIDVATFPEALYVIGADEALSAVLECIDDPTAGVKALERNISELRFHAQLATIGKEDIN